MFDRYIVRPDRQFLNGKYRIKESLYFAYLLTKPSDDSANDNQPDILVDDLIQNTQEPNNYPSSYHLCLQRKNCRRVKAVLRYHVPN